MPVKVRTVDCEGRTVPEEKTFLAKVTVCRQPSGQIKNRYLTADSDTEVHIARGLYGGGEKGKTAIVNAVYQDPEYREKIIEKIVHSVDEECNTLCSTKRPTLFRASSAENLSNFNIKDMINELRKNSDLLFEIIETIMNRKYSETNIPRQMTSENMYAVVASISVLLHQRNAQMSSFLHVMSLLLDFGGATDTTITKLHHCGITVTPTSITTKKKDIEELHDKQIEATLMHRRQHVEVTNMLPFHLRCVKLYSVKKSESVEMIQWVLQNAFPSFAVTPDLVHNMRISMPDAWEIYGDNVDHTVKAHHMTKMHSGQDIHWFLLVGAKLRVQPDVDLDQTRPRRNIVDVGNEEFLPTLDDHQSLQDSFIFHVMEVLVKYLPWLQQYKQCIPPHIEHEFIKEMSVKSEYKVVDILEKNENKSDEVIDIVERVHDFIPTDGFSVVERMTFGGDQLTNERAYEAQQEMRNGTTEKDQLCGVIHRTEGLHMCMNMCKLIMDYFYSKSSVRDQGTLYNLKAQLDRTDLKTTTDMTKGYNSCKAFIDDVLDGHIVALALEYYNVESLEDSPALPPLLEHGSKEFQCQYIRDVAAKLVDIILSRPPSDQPQGQASASALDPSPAAPDSSSAFTKTGDKYVCSFEGCSSSYSSLGWIKNHIRKKHSVQLERVTPKTKEDKSVFDGKFNYAVSFMKTALLFRDTRDIFKMGDGKRLFRNLKFLMLHFGECGHVKYHLWCWRLLAYDIALLSEYERFVFRNNIAVNMTGQTRGCIANDNLVEIHVKKTKECMRAMGPNLTFLATRRAVKCIDTVGKFVPEAKKKSGKHSKAKTTDDINTVVLCLQRNQILTHIPGRAHDTYPNIARDLLQNVNYVEKNKWISKQKRRAVIEMS